MCRPVVRGKGGIHVETLKSNMINQFWLLYDVRPARKNDSDTTKYFLTGPDFFMTSSYIVPGPALSLCQKLNSSSFYSRKQ